MGAKHIEAKFESDSHPYIIELTEKYQKTPAQIMLAWGLSRGYCVIPKVASDKNQIENFVASSFRLTQDEVDLVIKHLDVYHLLFKAWPDLGI